ncbi:Flp pilus assembly protein CpaB [Arthrobacter sp. SRS-W-1-2016]|uniref:Flp pilus assembly protein CpaB n=1 Tax=Arthrobacter sp. SRS-W-1-2016 TaxID=1930254 RepID=UPI0009C98124|nr:RcpC/CpaB family pilus assembly protein [Arthrobacter sp. SRS-W-1-2016]OOP60648.1 Flp pilus assembly protein CpaB [Arthrobacter sp. SRS-W-1-2016]
MKTRLLGGIAALVVAIIGTVMLVFYVQGADKRALANTETQDVYVIQKEIPSGTPTAKFGDSVIKKAVPKSAVAADSVTSLSDLGSKVSSIEFMPGEQLLASRMVDPNSLAGPGRVEVPTGLQEVTVKLPIERVVGGHIAAGDTVGMMLSFKADDKAGAPDQTSFTFHKVLVTAVQDDTGAISDSGSTASQGTSGSLNANKNTNANSGYLVTVARSAVDVQKIVYAAEFGTVYLSKEPSDAVAGATGIMDRGSVFK